MDALITLLPGDGIGPEVTKSGRSILDTIGKAINWIHALTGAAAIEAVGEPYPKETHEICLKSDAILFGAVGHPRFDNDPSAKVRPEQGLLKMRKDLGLFANVRPTFTFPSLIDKSPLKRERIEGTNLVFLRELTGGIYFGERGRLDNGNTAFDTCTYTRKEIERLAVKGFELAMKRSKRLCCVDKANVLETSRLWRETVQSLEKNYPEVKVSYEFILVDAAAMYLINRPADFDVIVTENMFGDILTDEASMLSGSMGMLPFPSKGSNKFPSLFEPVHGSAPDIAGKGIANPCGMIGSVALLLRHSLNLNEEADLLEQAIYDAIEGGARTADIATNNENILSTDEMTNVIINRLKK